MLKTHMLAGVVAIMLFATPALSQGQKCAELTDLTPSATLAGSGRAVGFVIGMKRGDGILRMKDGREYAFSIRTAKALQTGASRTEIEGTVYNLSDPLDFAGTYTGAGVSVALIKLGPGEISLSNGKCVVMKLTPIAKGVQLSPPGPKGVLVTLQD